MKRLKHLTISIVTASAILALSGCSVVPKSFTTQEYEAIILQDKKVLSTLQEPIASEVSLEEAIARSLKYNLENRVSVMEAAIRNRQLDLSTYDMLPKLVAGAGYTSRNKEDLSVSKNTITGILSDQPSESADKQRDTADLKLSWNVLDFGVSYYQAQQQADMVLIAEQNRRRMSNQIVQKVRDAYWRAAATQPIVERVKPLLVQAKESLADSERALSQRLSPPLEALTYQKTLLGVIRDLEVIEHESIKAKFELASLMGVIPTDAYRVIVPSELSIPKLDMLPDVLVEKAFLQRPELQQEAYQYRISTLEAKKALLKVFPSLNFITGIEYDSNSYKINNTWAETGVRLSWNLMNLFSGPKAIEMAHAQEELALLRRQTMAMSVMTQVYVGYQEYMRTTQLFEKSDKMSILEHEIFLHVKNGAEQKTQTKLELMRTELSTINADLTRYKAYSEMQNALASLNLSIGLDALPKVVESHELEPLKEAIGTSMAQNTVAVKEKEEVVVQSQPIIEVEKVKEEVKELTTETVLVSKEEIVKAVPETLSANDISTKNEDINLVLNQWADAWSRNDFQAYKAFYSRRFISTDGKKYTTWIKGRDKLVTKNKLITLILTDRHILSQTENEVVVRFYQNYAAAHLNESIYKTLRLIKENGTWKIIAETVE